MSDLITFLDGKKAYIVALIAAVTAGVQALGYHIPDYVYLVEGALGLGAIRVAISKSGGNYITSDKVTGPLVANTVNVQEASGPITTQSAK